MAAKRAHHVLVIDGNDWDNEQIRSLLRQLSMPVQIVRDSELATPGVHVDLIILGFSDVVSLETSRALVVTARSQFPAAQVIACAPRDMPDLDRHILETGARSFLLKPLDGATFSALLKQTLSQIELRRTRTDGERVHTNHAETPVIVGRSEEIRAVLRVLDQVAQSATTAVLFLGESGVGKSLFAQTVHGLCHHATGPFIEINCATLPTALLESELFGYEPGAYTDARARKAGLIELADGGTLFLDEITEIDPVTQAKLLKFLDSKRFRRLGGEREISVEVRVVAASNRNIREEVRRGDFREDLFYRLNVVEVNIPPLRERTNDIDDIVAHYFDHYKRKFGKPDVTLSTSARALIKSYPWPGNVRELINVLERAVLLCPSDEILPEHLPIDRRSGVRRRLALTSEADGSITLQLPSGGVSLDVLERAAIFETLKITHGNVSRAADMLGLSRGALRNRLTRYRIDARRFTRRALLSQR